MPFTFDELFLRGKRDEKYTIDDCNGSPIYLGELKMKDINNKRIAFNNGYIITIAYSKNEKITLETSYAFNIMGKDSDKLKDTVITIPNCTDNFEKETGQRIAPRSSNRRKPSSGKSSPGKSSPGKKGGRSKTKKQRRTHRMKRGSIN